MVDGCLAEWLRRKTRNLLGFPRAGSNPAAIIIFYFLPSIYKIKIIYSPRSGFLSLLFTWSIYLRISSISPRPENWLVIWPILSSRPLSCSFIFFSKFPKSPRFFSSSLRLSVFPLPPLSNTEESMLSRVSLCFFCLT